MRSLASRSSTSPRPPTAATAAGATVPVVDSEFQTCYQVPAAMVAVAPGSKRFDNLRLCRNFCTQGRCPRGDDCQFLHLSLSDVSTCPKNAVHVNRAWKCLDDAPKDRHPASTRITVHRPKQWDKCIDIAGDHVLQTQGSRRYLAAICNGEAQNPVPLCAHYLINQMCRIGSNCNFVHYVTVDPNVKVSGQRAKRQMLPTVSAMVVTDDDPSESSHASLPECMSHASSPGMSSLSQTATFSPIDSTGSMSPRPAGLTMCGSTTSQLTRVYTHNPYPTSNIYLCTDDVATFGRAVLGPLAL